VDTEQHYHSEPRKEGLWHIIYKQIQTKTNLARKLYAGVVSKQSTFLKHNSGPSASFITALVKRLLFCSHSLNILVLKNGKRQCDDLDRQAASCW